VRVGITGSLPVVRLWEYKQNFKEVLLENLNWSSVLIKVMDLLESSQNLHIQNNRTCRIDKTSTHMVCFINQFILKTVISLSEWKSLCKEKSQ
jgi:hypothetical protein